MHKCTCILHFALEPQFEYSDDTTVRVSIISLRATFIENKNAAVCRQHQQTDWRRNANDGKLEIWEEEDNVDDDCYLNVVVGCQITHGFGINGSKSSKLCKGSTCKKNVQIVLNMSMWQVFK